MEKSLEKIGKFQVKQIGEPADRTLRFLGTDETEDRDRDIIKADGWKLDNYLKNPVFLPFHNSWTVPVGKCVAIGRGSGIAGLTFDIKFPSIEELCTNPATPSDEALLADALYNAFLNGYMNAVSIGFVPLESVENDSGANKDLPQWQRGRIFTSQEMIELSAVAIPANPNALIQARSFKNWKPGQLDLISGILDPTDKSAHSTESVAEPAPIAKTTETEQETDMKAEEVTKAISEAVEPLLQKIANLEASQKSGAKFSAKTLECLTTALDHIMKGHGLLKGLMDGDGSEPEGQSPSETEPGIDNTSGQDGDKAYGIDLSKLDLDSMLSA